MRASTCLVCVPLLLAAACETKHPPPPPFGRVDGGPRCTDVYEPPATPGDVDADGIPNDMDDDADGDGIDNAFEHVGGFSCAGGDADGDGTANWLDTDSDNDGLLDSTEDRSPSGPYDADTDDDGTTDLIELAAGTDPTAAASSLHEGDQVVLLPHMGGEQTVTIRFVNRVENGDVFFLVDTTGTMLGELTTLIATMKEVIVPRLALAFRDVMYGVGGFEDYPVSGYGDSAFGDRPFYLVTAMIDGEVDTKRRTMRALESLPNGEPDIVDALEVLTIRNGLDDPESYPAALWATATGMALTWSGGEVPSQDCGGAGLGYPCFRPDALPIVLLFGDAPFHNGPDNAHPYDLSLLPDAPAYDQAVAALVGIGARVVSVYSGSSPEGLDHFRRLATATGALGPDGMPLVFTVAEDGTGLDATVIEALERLADGKTQDVTVRSENGPSNPDGFDATSFVVTMVTGEGYSAAGDPGPSPGVSYTSKDATTFYSLVGGAACEYVLTLANAGRPSGPEARVFRLISRAAGDGGATFATRSVFIVVPAVGSMLIL